ncbi:hypothetical protein [uncultured Fibrella sp.]|uniref:hypothetical protein n=1 Tax=uncultured Fibrella sp. TaxID=1284596 RepID=UPI0035CBFA28
MIPQLHKSGDSYGRLCPYKSRKITTFRSGTLPIELPGTDQKLVARYVPAYDEQLL